MSDESPVNPAMERKFRNRFLIFPKFQLVLIGMNLITMLLVCGVVWFQVSRAFSELRVMGGASGMEAEFYNKFLAFHAGTIQSYLFSGLLVGILLTVAMTVVVSHRFAGPLVRLRGYFKALKDCKGPIPRLNFRRGDFLGDLPPIINEALENLEPKQAQGPAAVDQDARPRLRAVK